MKKFLLYFFLCIQILFAENKELDKLLVLAEKNDSNAQYDLGATYYNLGKYEESKTWYHRSAKNDNALAQLYLGLAYHTGTIQGFKENVNDAFFWYKKAAEKNNAIAQYYMGYMYLKGESVNQDNKNALFWFKKSYENGFKDAKKIIDYLEK